VEEDEADDDEDFTINLNLSKLPQREVADHSIRPVVKFIDEQQEISAIEDLTSGLLANLNAPLQELQ